MSSQASGRIVLLDRSGRPTKAYPLQSGTATLGHARESNLRVLLPTIENHHATLMVHRNQVVIRSEGYGETLVNGVPVSVTSLRHGDVITVVGSDGARKQMRWEYDNPSLHIPLATQPALVKRVRGRRSKRRVTVAAPRHLDYSLHHALLTHRPSMPGNAGGKQVAIVQPRRRDDTQPNDTAPRSTPSSPRSQNRSRSSRTELASHTRATGNGSPEPSTSQAADASPEPSRVSSSRACPADTTQATLWIESRRPAPRRTTGTPPPNPSPRPTMGARAVASAKKSTPLRVVVLRKSRSAHKMKVTKIQAPLQIDHMKQAALMLMTGGGARRPNSSPALIIKKHSPVNRRRSNKKTSKGSSDKSVSVLEVTDTASPRDSMVTAASDISTGSERELSSTFQPSPKKSALKDPKAKRNSRKNESIKFDLSNLENYSGLDEDDSTRVDTKTSGWESGRSSVKDASRSSGRSRNASQNSTTSSDEVTLRYSESSSPSPTARSSIHGSRASTMLDAVGSPLTHSPSKRKTITPPSSPSGRKSLRGSIILQKALEDDNSLSRRSKTRTLSPRNIESYSVVDLVSKDSIRESSVYDSAGSTRTSSIMFGTPSQARQSRNSTLNPCVMIESMSSSTPYVSRGRARSSPNLSTSKSAHKSTRRSASLTTPDNTEETQKQISINSTRISRASKSRSRLHDSSLLTSPGGDGDSPRSSRRNTTHNTSHAITSLSPNKSPKLATPTLRTSSPKTSPRHQTSRRTFYANSSQDTTMDSMSPKRPRNRSSQSIIPSDDTQDEKSTSPKKATPQTSLRNQSSRRTFNVNTSQDTTLGSSRSSRNRSSQSIIPIDNTQDERSISPKKGTPQTSPRNQSSRRTFNTSLDNTLGSISPRSPRGRTSKSIIPIDNTQDERSISPKKATPQTSPRNQSSRRTFNANTSQDTTLGSISPRSPRGRTSKSIIPIDNTQEERSTSPKNATPQMSPRNQSSRRTFNADTSGDTTMGSISSKRSKNRSSQLTSPASTVGARPSTLRTSSPKNSLQSNRSSRSNISLVNTPDSSPKNSSSKVLASKISSVKKASPKTSRKELTPRISVTQASLKTPRSEKSPKKATPHTASPRVARRTSNKRSSQMLPSSPKRSSLATASPRRKRISFARSKQAAMQQSLTIDTTQASATEDEGTTTPEHTSAPPEQGTPVLSIQSLLDSSHSSFASHRSPRQARTTTDNAYTTQANGKGQSIKSKSFTASARRSLRAMRLNSNDRENESILSNEEESVTPKSAIKLIPEGVKNKHSTEKRPQSKRSIIDNLNDSVFVKQLFNSPVKRKLARSMDAVGDVDVSEQPVGLKGRRARHTLALAEYSPQPQSPRFSPERFVSPLMTPAQSPNRSLNASSSPAEQPPRSSRPRKSVKNDLTNVSGVKKLFARSPRNRLSDVRVKEVFTAAPENDLRRVSGVRSLFRKQNERANKNDLSNVSGVRSLFKRKSATNDLTNISGVKKVFTKSPKNDLRDVRGVRKMFQQHAARKDESLDLSGVEELFDVSTVSSTSHADPEVLFDQLVGKPPIKAVYSKSYVTKRPQKGKKSRHAKSFHTSIDLITNNVEEWIQKELQKHLHKDKTDRVARELNKLATDTVEGATIRTSRVRNSTLVKSLSESGKRLASQIYDARSLPIKKRSLERINRSGAGVQASVTLPLKKRTVVHSTPLKGSERSGHMDASELGRVSPIRADNTTVQTNTTNAGRTRHTTTSQSKTKNISREITALAKTLIKPKAASRRCKDKASESKNIAATAREGVPEIQEGGPEIVQKTHGRARRVQKIAQPATVDAPPSPKQTRKIPIEAKPADDGEQSELQPSPRNTRGARAKQTAQKPTRNTRNKPETTATANTKKRGKAFVITKRAPSMSPRAAQSGSAEPNNTNQNVGAQRSTRRTKVSKTAPTEEFTAPAPRTTRRNAKTEKAPSPKKDKGRYTDKTESVESPAKRSRRKEQANPIPSTSTRGRAANKPAAPETNSRKRKSIEEPEVPAKVAKTVRGRKAAQLSVAEELPKGRRKAASSPDKDNATRAQKQDKGSKDTAKAPRTSRQAARAGRNQKQDNTSPVERNEPQTRKRKASPATKAPPAKKPSPAKIASVETESVVKRASRAQKAAPKNKSSVKKASPAKKASPEKKASPVKKASRAQKAVPKKTSPLKKASPAKKPSPPKKESLVNASPVKRASRAQKAVPAKKASSKKESNVKKASPPAKKATVKQAVAKKATPVKKVHFKKDTPVRKTKESPVKKATRGRKAAVQSPSPQKPASPAQAARSSRRGRR